VICFSVALILLAAAFFAFDLLGRELVPSEDQSRFVVHVRCPVGSSIKQVSELLQECENVLVDHHEVAGLLTTVATEPGQLMNEADIFVHLVPQEQRPVVREYRLFGRTLWQRRRSQGELLNELRGELEQIRDVRITMRDLSTEGFTAQRGDPVDFAIQGDWQRLPAVADKVEREMLASGAVRDVDSDYRPGMPELQIGPDRENLAMIGMPVNRVADSMSLLVGGKRVGKYTDRGRRYDVRARLQLAFRDSPDDLDPLAVRAGDDRLVS